ncbi:MAG TPA: GDSL-type esterase/lipase family protein [Candidatus Limnocylindrales bacterium]
MDPNLTGRGRPPAEIPPRGPIEPRSGALAGLNLGRRGAVAIGALLLVTLAFIFAVAGWLGAGNASTSFAPSASQLAVASASPTPRPSATATASPAPIPTASRTSTPGPTAPLPALLAAIGDSYSQAYSVSPAYPYDHPQFSWVIGTAKGDGVFSLLERFQALGDSPVVVDAATSGRTMADAPRQAAVVVAAAKKLAPGKTAYVTFELGTNDLCASPNPMTDTVDFQVQLRTAILTLRTGLPPGSRILILAVPDFPHFHDITQADPAARTNLALLQNSDRCAPYLGTNGPSSTAQADSYLSQYDASLKQMCDDIDANEAATGHLFCTYNASLLAESDFTIQDLSTVDYFHPSLSGQAKMAANAWRADVWASVPLSSSATGRGIAAANAPADSESLGLALPLVPMARRRRETLHRMLVASHMPGR